MSGAEVSIVFAPVVGVAALGGVVVATAAAWQAQREARRQELAALAAAREQRRQAQDQQLVHEEKRFRARAIHQNILALGGKFDNPPHTGLDAYIERGLAAIQQARERNAAAGSFTTLPSTAAAVPLEAPQRFKPGKPEPDSGPDQVGERIAVVRQSLAAFAQRFAVPLPEEVEQRLAALATAADEASAEQAALAIGAALGSAIEILESEQKEATLLVAQLPNLPDTTELHADLAEVIAGRTRLSDEARHYANEFIRSASSGVDTRRERAGMILQKALEASGYIVEPIEKTMFTQGGHLHLTHPQWPDGHFVRLRVTRNSMQFKPMREQEAPNGENSATMERHWCGALPGLVERLQTELKGESVTLKLERQTPAGQETVRTVDSKQVAAVKRMRQEKLSSGSKDATPPLDIHTPASKTRSTHG